MSFGRSPQAPRLAQVRRSLVVLTLAVSLPLAGCDRRSSPPEAGTTPSAPATTSNTPTTAPTPTVTPTAGRLGTATTPSPPPRPRHLRYVFPVQRCSSSYSTSHHDYPASD